MMVDDHLTLLIAGSISNDHGTDRARTQLTAFTLNTLVDRLPHTKASETTSVVRVIPDERHVYEVTILSEVLHFICQSDVRVTARRWDMFEFTSVEPDG